jgi:hypothetical protein
MQIFVREALPLRAKYPWQFLVILGSKMSMIFGLFGRSFHFSGIQHGVAFSLLRQSSLCLAGALFPDREKQSPLHEGMKGHLDVMSALVTYFHASTASNFRFLNRRLPSVRHDKDGDAIRSLPDRRRRAGTRQNEPVGQRRLLQVEFVCEFESMSNMSLLGE